MESLEDLNFKGTLIISVVCYPDGLAFISDRTFKFQLFKIAISDISPLYNEEDASSTFYNNWTRCDRSNHFPSPC